MFLISRECANKLERKNNTKAMPFHNSLAELEKQAEFSEIKLKVLEIKVSRWERQSLLKRWNAVVTKGNKNRPQ